ncbi:polysaccharide biosynthesis C-terminal domain-containing protein [Bacillus sp. AFS053548]|uniref:oligosaccharide flippase family protein n=1 Tax=Bacillus sp. AFS053548 TaxID=2033505 RepID=UPI000BFBFE18|nr:polysaccharide biosynthesis C-terminal domain-containing protein [Bacillus sp. AFS053548]PGM56743.1 hypothetical protein CN946_09940 [Bacillus sp. AFS053548]
MKIKNLIKGNTLYLICSLIIVRGMEFLARTIIANNQGPAVNGKIQIFETYFNIFLLATIFGMNSSMLKYTSSKDSKKKLAEVFSTILGLNFIISIIVSIIISIFVRILFNGQTDLIFAFTLISIVLPIFSITSFSQGTFVHLLLGIGDIKKSSKFKLIASFIMFLLLTFFTIKFGFKGYYITYFIYIIISIFPCIYLFKEYLDLRKVLEVVVSFKTLIKSVYIKFALPAFIANCLSLLIINVDVIVLSLYSISSQLIGLYSIAILISRGILIIPMGYLQSNFSKINQKLTEDKKLYIFIYKKELRNLCILMLPITIFFIIFSTPIIHLIFNETYENSIDLTRLLMISTFFQSLGMVAGNIFLILEKVKLNLYMNIIRLVLVSIFSFIFLKLFGIYGLAISNIITNLIFISIQGLLIRSVKIN